MRNKITLITTLYTRPPVFSELNIGQMFSYEKTSDIENVYMKTDNGQAILLSTGYLYDVGDGAQLVRIVSVNIS